MSVSSTFPGFPLTRHRVFLNPPRLTRRLPLVGREAIPRLHRADAVVVLAHPDDETFMTGTLARLAQNGYKVQLVYATSGDAGKNLLGKVPRRKTLADLREHELRGALRELDIDRPAVMLRYPDGKTQDNTRAIETDIQAILQRTQPRVVITFGPDGMTGHPDHVTIGQLTDEASRDTGHSGHTYHMAISREAFCRHLGQKDLNTEPTDPLHWNLKPSADPVAVHVDVHDEIDKKYESMRWHQSQFTGNEASMLRAWYWRYSFEEFAKARQPG